MTLNTSDSQSTQNNTSNKWWKWKGLVTVFSVVALSYLASLNTTKEEQPVWWSHPVDPTLSVPTDPKFAVSEILVIPSEAKINDPLDSFIREGLSTGHLQLMFSNISRLDKKTQRSVLKKLIDLWMFAMVVKNFQSFNQLSKTDLEPLIFTVFERDYRDLFAALLQNGLFAKSEILEIMMSNPTTSGKLRSISAIDMLVDGTVYKFLKSLKWTSQENLLLSYWEYAKFLSADEKKDLYEFAAQLTQKDGNQMVVMDPLLAPNMHRIAILQDHIAKWEYQFISSYLTPDDQIDKASVLAAMISSQAYVAIIENAKNLWVPESDIYQYVILILQQKNSEAVIKLAWNGFIPLQFITSIFDYMISNSMSLESVILYPSLHIFLPNKLKIVDTIIAKNELGANLLIAISIEHIRPTKLQTQTLLWNILNSKNDILLSHVGKIITYLQSLG